MRVSLLTLVLILSLVRNGVCEPIRLPSFGGGDRLEIVEKENIRRRVGGRYDGYVYREYRGMLNEIDSTSEQTRYEGSFYVLEDVRLLGSRAKLVEDTRRSLVTLSAAGLGVDSDDEVGVSAKTGYPRTLGFPVMPPDRVVEGDAWRGFGTRVVDPRLNGKGTNVRFYCEYRYDGVTLMGTDEVYSIRAQYALRYRQGDDPDGDPDLVSVSGSHIAHIAVYADGSGRVFVRTQVDEQYRFRDGPEITNQGFLLTWLEDTIRLDRRATIAAIEDRLREEGIRDVEVSDREEGVSISLERIHFVPDSPEILPDEVGRLDTLFSALSGIADRTFLVVGHTADVGTAESQLLLSVDRAKTVIEGLVARGISAERFVYTGKGGTEPVATNDTDEGRAKNRRVEIVILD